MAEGRRAVLHLEPLANEENLAAPGEVGMSQAVIGLERQRTFQQRHRDPRLGRHGSIGMGQSPEQEIISIEILGPLALDALDLGLTKAGLYGADRAQRDL